MEKRAGEPVLTGKKRVVTRVTNWWVGWFMGSKVWCISGGGNLSPVACRQEVCQVIASDVVINLYRGVVPKA